MPTAIRLRAVPLWLLLVLLGGACSAPGSGGTGCESSLWWRDAREKIGTWATVRGPVVDSRFAVDGEGQPTFLDLGNPYPDPDRFTVRIWGRDRVNFPSAPEQTYRNRTVCVSGWIDTSMGSPGMDVAQASSLAVQ